MLPQIHVRIHIQNQDDKGKQQFKDNQHSQTTSKYLKIIKIHQIDLKLKTHNKNTIKKKLKHL